MPINYNEGMQCEFQQIVSWMTFETASDYHKYFKRLEALPDRVSDKF